jgi:SHS2 domain-containing protein
MQGERAGFVYELFEHTADLGLRVRAVDLDRLFEEAGLGLFSMIVEPLPATVEHEAELRVAGRRRDWLLFDWLSELLHLFESERLLCGAVSARVGASGVEATVGGERVDPARHRLQHEVKAITYHGLKVEPTADGWLAEVIVDI